jgi:hypothetical protein
MFEKLSRLLQFLKKNVKSSGWVGEAKVLRSVKVTSGIAFSNQKL